MAETLSSEQSAEYKQVADVGPGVVEPEQGAQKADKPEPNQSEGHGHRVWDPKTERFVEPPKQERDKAGRFSALTQSLQRDAFEQSKRRQEWLQMLESGAVEPSEQLSANEWAKARNAQIANRTQNIQAPDAPKEAHAAKPESTAQELSPEEIKHFENHETFISTLAAKMAVDAETRDAVTGLRNSGMPQAAIVVMGHAIADVENPHEVVLALGKAPEVAAMYSQLSPQGMHAAIRALSEQLKQQAQVAATPKPAKPAPPAPVGARAASVAFDVNDDKTDISTWMKERHKQVYGGR